MERSRVNVTVYAKFSAEGGMIPVCVVWENGVSYPVGRVLSVSRAPDRVRAVLPVKYTCTISGRVKELYFEPREEVWFVEAEV